VGCLWGMCRGTALAWYTGKGISLTEAVRFRERISSVRVMFKLQTRCPSRRRCSNHGTIALKMRHPGAHVIAWAVDMP
jgi:hypothetical protein